MRGYWLSALDHGNFVTFYGEAGQKLFTFDPQDILDVLSNSRNKADYYGNPNAGWVHGKDSDEPFIFMNFFDTTGSFSKVEFSEGGNYGGSYESDNHTVGHYETFGDGAIIEQIHSITAPEPSTWAMMLLGFAGLGSVAFARGRKQPIGII